VCVHGYWVKHSCCLLCVGRWKCFLYGLERSLLSPGAGCFVVFCRGSVCVCFVGMQFLPDGRARDLFCVV